jgi:O-antigen/teichoic acid export membrane protein
MSRDSLRIVLWLLPLAGMVAGAAPGIIGWIFGRPFLPAAALLGWLSLAAVALATVSVEVAIVTAAGKPRWTVLMVGPLVPFALLGHLLLIPRWGALGAALVTTVVAGGGAVMGLVPVYRCCRVLPPLLTVCRSVIVAGAAAALAGRWPSPGLLLLLKLPGILLIVAGLYFLLGEFDAAEIAGARALLRTSAAWAGKVRA